MAEMNLPQKGGKRKRHPIRIDFTPMVDLGFLLITFFMYTTTLANPKVIDINMPTDDPEPTVFVEESTISLIPIAMHKVAYYNGILRSEEQLQYCSVGEVRNVLLKKRSEVAALPASFSREAHMLHVLIKPNEDCKYQDVVSILDEMTLLDVKYYAIMDVSAEEKKWMKK